MSTITATLSYDEAGLFAEHRTESERVERLMGDFQKELGKRAAEVVAAVEPWNDIADLGIVNVKTYGAIGDGKADDTEAIRAAIDAGQTVYFPATGSPENYYRTTEPIAPRSNQLLVGGGFQNASYGVQLTRISSTHDGPLVQTDGASSVTLRGLVFGGSGGENRAEGLDIANGNDWLIEHCHFNQFGGRAIRWRSGSAMRIDACFAMNCVMVRTGHTDYIGVFDLAGHDPMVTRNEVTSSQLNSLTTGYIAALRVDGGNGFYSQNVWEISEAGVVCDDEAYRNTFVNDRADTNSGHGWIVRGDANRFIGCRAMSNGKAADNTYDGFWLTFEALRNHLIGCIAENDAGSNGQRYGFHDDTTATGASRNLHSLYHAIEMKTAPVNNGGSGIFLDLYGVPTVTGATGGNAALEDLLTKLAAMGLIVDGSS